ncbi:MAG: ribonucleotide reductase N-terminal alpha domain-containing protein [Sulfuricurvum sp.]
MSNKYEQLSHKRKQLQADDLAPPWMSTSGYQLLDNQSYLNTAETPRDMYTRIANRAGELTTFEIPSYLGYPTWKEAFFDVMWKGWLSPSTPVLTNMGNSRGHPIACSGTHLGDSIRSFYTGRTEIAQLTQRGYGTSWCLDPVRSRGSDISKGGNANGVMQPAKGAVQDTKDISQGTRRGSIGQYLDVMHPDFDELVDQIIADHDGWNIGWNLTDEYRELFNRDPDEADRIWKRILKTRLTPGKGYMYFLDKVNEARPQVYKDKGFFVRHSNLCAEINLMSDENHSFTCVLSSMNISKYDEWKNTYAIQIATVFLDAVVSDMLIKAKQEEGFERIIAFTEKSRALGLGQLGQSTYYQQKSWVFGDMDSILFNQQLVKELDRESLIASKLLAKELGEPEWLTGYGIRNTHRLAFPPTKSTAVIMGGISDGIMPVFANVYEQDTAGGLVYRINPVLLPIMKERGKYTEEVMSRISEAQGSVQGEDWLSPHEKAVFKTAFELNQETLLLMASHRQRIMNEGGGGQGQSLNLYFPMEATEEEISRIHNIAFEDPYIQSLYYVHSLNEPSTYLVDRTSCESCNG